VHAQDPRVALFETYNDARSYDDVEPLVSAVLAQRYALVAFRDPGRLADVLAQQQLASYRSRIVDVNATNGFLVLEHVQPDSIVKTLWTRDFSPSEFAQPASCAVDGRQLATASALAVRRGDTVELSLYPFQFTQADLEYRRRMSGVPAREAAGDSHFSHRIPTVCGLVVKVGNAGRPSLLNVGFDDQSGAVLRSSLWQPSKTDVSRLAYENDVIELATAGRVGADSSGFRWNVRIEVPVWRMGL
jgi:hypothetical protein